MKFKKHSHLIFHFLLVKKHQYLLFKNVETYLARKIHATSHIPQEFHAIALALFEVHVVEAPR